MEHPHTSDLSAPSTAGSDVEDLREILVRCEASRVEIIYIAGVFQSVIDLGRSGSNWPGGLRGELPPAGISSRHDFMVESLLGWLRGGSAEGTSYRSLSRHLLSESIPGFDVPQDLAVLSTWVRSLGGPEHIPSDYTCQDALSAALEWYSLQCDRIPLRSPCSAAPEIIRFDDGARIVRLVTPEQFTEEGMSMGHCLRGVLHYFDDALRGDIVILSYRDGEGVPKVTVELDITADEPVLIQLQGPGNGRILDEACIPRMAWFLTRWMELSVDDIDTRWLSRMGLAPASWDIDSPFPADEAGWREDEAVDRELLGEIDESLRDFSEMKLSVFFDLIRDAGSFVVPAAPYAVGRSPDGSGLIPSRAWEVLLPGDNGLRRLFMGYRAGEVVWWVEGNGSVHIAETPLESLRASGVDYFDVGAVAVLASDEEALSDAGRAASIDMSNGLRSWVLDGDVVRLSIEPVAVELSPEDAR